MKYSVVFWGFITFSHGGVFQALNTIFSIDLLEKGSVTKPYLPKGDGNILPNPPVKSELTLRFYGRDPSPLLFYQTKEYYFFIYKRFNNIAFRFKLY